MDQNKISYHYPRYVVTINRCLNVLCIMIDWQLQLIIGEISNSHLTQWKLYDSVAAQNVCGMKFALQHTYLLPEEILNLIL